MQVKFSKYSRKLSEIVTNCEFDFMLKFALNGDHLGHHLHCFNLVNQTCECFILIVCIIRPLNINKKSKLKCFISNYQVFSRLGLIYLVFFEKRFINVLLPSCFHLGLFALSPRHKYHLDPRMNLSDFPENCAFVFCMQQNQVF